MADYTLLNLRNDVEDMAPGSGMGDGIEAHFGRKALKLSRSGLSYLKLAPGYTVPFGHSHAEQEEVYLVIDGSARVKLDDEEIELQRLDAVRIGTGVTRGLAAGPDGTELILFGAPDTDNRDISMVKGFFAD
jgi:quercetin dioxygenase-like cupin family protein